MARAPKQVTPKFISYHNCDRRVTGEPEKIHAKIQGWASKYLEPSVPSRLLVHRDHSATETIRYLNEHAEIWRPFIEDHPDDRQLTTVRDPFDGVHGPSHYVFNFPEGLPALWEPVMPNIIRDQKSSVWWLNFEFRDYIGVLPPGGAISYAHNTGRVYWLFVTICVPFHAPTPEFVEFYSTVLADFPWSFTVKRFMPAKIVQPVLLELNKSK